jgi:methylmalonyl-CoA mutase C-terminal domain/subunit
MKELQTAGLDYVKVIVGGIVPDEEEKDLLKAGVARVFHPGADMADIVSTVQSLAGEAQNDATRQL